MRENKLSTVKNLTPLECSEQQTLKGGLYITCEEKRRKIMGYTFIERSIVVKQDGSPFLSMRM